jgi:hypothetical protein
MKTGETMNPTDDTILAANTASEWGEWDGPDVFGLLEKGVTRAYKEFRELELTSRTAGEGGEALVAALCKRRGWIIEVRYVSMDELPTYTGFVRRVGPKHWIIDVRDDVTAGQADIIIAHEVSHILHDDVTAEGVARPRVIPVTPPEIVAKAFSVTIGRLFTYGDHEGERATMLARLPSTWRSIASDLPRGV